MKVYRAIPILFLVFEIYLFSGMNTFSMQGVEEATDVKYNAEMQRELYDSMFLLHKSPAAREAWLSVSIPEGPIDRFRASREKAHPRVRKHLQHFDAFGYLANNQIANAVGAAKKAWEKGEQCPELLGIMMCANIEEVGDVEEYRKYLKNIRYEASKIIPISEISASNDLAQNRKLLKPVKPKVIDGKIVQTIVFGREIPSIPTNDFGWSRRQIASIYKEMGFNRLAINNYIEGMYGSKLQGDGRSWLEVARLEEIEGQEELSLRAYLQSISLLSFSREESEEGIQRILEGKIAKSKKPIVGKWDVEKAKKIAGLHKMTNVHPLGIIALYRAQEATGVSLQKEIDELTKDWNRIIDYYIENKERRNEYQFYGVKVPADDDWTKVNIKRPSDTFWVPEDLSKMEKQEGPEQP